MANRMNPSNIAVRMLRNFLRFCAFGVQMARKSAIIQTIASSPTIVPKLTLMSDLRRLAMSFGSIPKIVIKNPAESGLKTMYDKKLPKKIILTIMRDPMSLSIVVGEVRCFGGFGGGVFGGRDPPAGGIGGGGIGDGV